MIRWTARLVARLVLPGVCALSVALAAHPAAVDDTTPLSALWEPPASLPDRDLFYGPWGAERAPDPAATYTFIRPKKGGVNSGVIVRDDRDRVWHVKQAPRASRGAQGAEGPVEVVLSRVLSAVGYHQPPVYFLPSFTLVDRTGTHVATGGRFRLEEPTLKAQGPWSWRRNPYVGTRPYEGLIAILLVFNSWDLKDSNNTIYDVKGDGRVDRWFVVRDLGAALGESARLAPRRNNIDRFERQKFITGVTDGFVNFTYHGWQPQLVHRALTVEDVQWGAALLANLSDRQWHDAFRAGGYPDDLTARFLRKIKSNLAEARQLGSGATEAAREAR
jgi:hypothetical protein